MQSLFRRDVDFVYTKGDEQFVIRSIKAEYTHKCENSWTFGLFKTKQTIVDEQLDIKKQIEQVVRSDVFRADPWAYVRRWQATHESDTFVNVLRLLLVYKRVPR